MVSRCKSHRQRPENIPATSNKGFLALHETPLSVIKLDAFQMSAIQKSELPNSPCNGSELQIDSTTEYCAQWLAAIPAAQHDENRQPAPAAPVSLPRSEEYISSYQISPQAACLFSRPAAHHHIEVATLPPQPSSAPSHVDATPEPQPECSTGVPCSESPRIHAGQTSKYEKRPRRKTRPDRYDSSRQHRERTTLSRRERREQKKEKLRSRKEIVTNFHSSATENRNILVRSCNSWIAMVC